jgi:hypothetical protein
MPAVPPVSWRSSVSRWSLVSCYMAASYHRENAVELSSKYVYMDRRKDLIVGCAVTVAF